MDNNVGNIEYQSARKLGVAHSDISPKSYEDYKNFKIKENQEMFETLSDVAKMKAHFDLLKNVILSKMSLDYYGKDLRLEDSALLTEVMWLIAPEAMDEILEHEKEQLRQEKEKKEAKNNG